MKNDRLQLVNFILDNLASMQPLGDGTYKRYPTIRDLTRMVNDNGITGQDLTFQGVRNVILKLESAGLVRQVKTSSSNKIRIELLKWTWDRNEPYPRAAKSSSPRRVASNAPGLNAEDIVTLVKAGIEASLPEFIGLAVAEASNDILRVIRKDVPVKVQHETTVKIANMDAVKIQGKMHSSFNRCVRLAANRRNIMLIGPAGCGKTHLAAQVAQALNLPFAHVSCSVGMSESAVLGRVLPTNTGAFEYQRTDFIKCYEEGGVFLFDEIDAADPNVLLVVNAALAKETGGEMPLPGRADNPVAVKHKDFVVMAAANTFGTGADRQYVGRNQLDESTLDRFRIGQVEMDYDADVEEALCPNEQLRTRLQRIRQAVRTAKLRRVVSTRFLRDAYVMNQAGDTMEDMERALFAGWNQDELTKVRSIAG